MRMTPRWLALALLLTACGARTSLDDPPADAVSTDASEGGPLLFPVGIYTNCAQGIGSTSGNILGAEPDASLTITQSGSSLRAELTGAISNATRQYDLALSTSTSATLVPNGRGEPGAPHACVLGLGSIDRNPTTLVADTGALQTDGDTVFLAVQGTATDTTPSPCGSFSDRQSVWISCTRRDRTAPAPMPAPVALGAVAFPSGSFACQSELMTYDLFEGRMSFAANGAMGSLTLTRDGSSVALSYTDDRVTATMGFVLASDASARAAGQGAIEAVCDAPIGTPAAMGRAPLAGTTGALLAVGSTLFVSVAGTMTAPCDGALKYVTLVCSTM